MSREQAKETAVFRKWNEQSGLWLIVFY